MIALENLLNLICTEAFEHGGIPEVPDNKHGAPQNYASEKRDARGLARHDPPSQPKETPILRFDLELIEEKDGTLRWIE